MTKKTLFIVEGESAASTVRQAMDKETQEVLATQGKLMNVDKISEEKRSENVQIRKINAVLGCGNQKACEPEELAFSRVVILTDPDMDGVHARVLLLKLFKSDFMPLIDQGLLFVRVPPSVRVVDSKNNDIQFFWSETELDEFINNHGSEKNLEVSRLKGVAQFSTRECREMLLAHDNLLKVVPK